MCPFSWHPRIIHILLMLCIRGTTYVHATVTHTVPEDAITSKMKMGMTSSITEWALNRETNMKCVCVCLCVRVSSHPHERQ